MRVMFAARGGSQSNEQSRDGRTPDAPSQLGAQLSEHRGSAV